MGEIYEAVQAPFGRRVALKVMRGPEQRLNADARERFQREEDILARLHHTHIVPILAAGTEGGVHYLSMPLIEGAPLNTILSCICDTNALALGGSLSLAEIAALLTPKPSGEEEVAGSTVTLPGQDNTPVVDGTAGMSKPSRTTVTSLSKTYFRSVARVMADAAGAIAHAHQAGVVHRDLKPSNLMVDRDARCWVIDFGLASAPGLESAPVDLPAEGDGAAGRHESGVVGSRFYMAPEQLEGQSGPSVDIWGLGTILYELLTLRRAFETRQAIRKREPEVPHSVVANVPPDLEAICLRALRKQPDQRYATAQDLADDLNR